MTGLVTMLTHSMLALTMFIAARTGVDPALVQDPPPATGDAQAESETERVSTPPLVAPVYVATPEVDALLTALEEGVRELRDFEAELRYDKMDAIFGETEIRSGDFLYDAGVEGRRRFGIHLKKVFVDRRREDINHQFIFDGEWLTEVNEKDKRYIRRQVVAPGDSFDPLKLGEGPFPLPIGQPKGEVIRRFETSLCPLPTEGILANARWLEKYTTDGTVQLDGLRLVPRSDTPAAEEFTEIKLFYDRKTRLPVGVIATQTDETIKTVRLDLTAHNKGIDATRLQPIQPGPNDGWRIQIEPWDAGRRRAGG